MTDGCRWLTLKCGMTRMMQLTTMMPTSQIVPVSMTMQLWNPVANATRNTCQGSKTKTEVTLVRMKMKGSNELQERTRASSSCKTSKWRKVRYFSGTN